MEELEIYIGPGTAGLAQRISSRNYEMASSENSISDTYIIEHNRVMECTQNQY